MEQLQKFVTDSGITRFFNNEIVVGIILLGTALYASLARPDLPSVMVRMFDYTIVKIIVYVLIAFLMTQNLQIAIVVAVVFFVVMSFASAQEVKETFLASQEQEIEQ
jgi:hypothetical protein